MDSIVLVELATLVVAALVGMSVSGLAATLWGIYTTMSHGSPIYYSVRTINLVVSLLILDIHSRDGSLSIYYTIPCLFLGTSAHFLGYRDELCSLLEDSVLRLLVLQAHLGSNSWSPWIAP